MQIPSFDHDMKYSYVSDSIVWGELFNKPFPKDIKNKNRGTVPLSDYFELSECPYMDNTKLIIGNFVQPKRNIYWNIDEYERNTVFTCLCDFLICYKRPYSHCRILIPPHPQSVPSEEFSPLVLSYSIPQYPLLDRENNYLQIDLSDNIELFDELSQYSKAHIQLAPDILAFRYSFGCFCGFIV